MRWRWGALRAEDGAVAGWEALPFGFLVFVVGTLVVANAWGVIDAKMASAAAAREGARAFVEAEDPGDARGDARRAAWAALDGHGRNPGAATVRVSGALRRCRTATVEVELPVPAIGLPWVGGLGAGLSARSVHAEVVDPLRSGLRGEADCVS